MVQLEAANALTAERLRTLLYYDPKIGVFSWRHGMPTARSTHINPRRTGDRAGCAGSKDGYWRIRIDRYLFLAHRLAWLYMTGEWPKEQIDHINRDRADNRWCNLRAASHRENMMNKKLNRNNKSGFRGVSFDKRSKKWTSKIMIHRKGIHLGYFADRETARDVYLVAARREFGNYLPN